MNNAMLTSELPHPVHADIRTLQTSDLKALSDDELLALIEMGQEPAFQTLVERHIDQGYAVAFRILKNSSDAEDILQDAFLQVWTRRGQWKPGQAKFSTWLFRVVTNRCIDQLRKARPTTLDELPELKDDQQSQSKSLEMQEAMDLLQRSIARLPDQQRIAIIFSYNENMSNREIAEIMETTVSAVESLLKRGKRKLREHLKHHSRDILSLFTQG